MTSYTDTACSICRQRDRQTDRHDDYRRTDRQTDRVHAQCARQWRTSGGAHQGAPGQMTWLEDPPPWLKPWLRLGSSPAYYFASVIEWKNVTISDRFICFILTAKRRWRPMFWGRQLKKVVNFFEEKSASGWPGWRFLWHTPLLRWRRHCDGHIPLPRK